MLKNNTYERVAVLTFENNKAEKKRTKKSMAEEMGVTDQYFGSISRRKEVIKRVKELEVEQESKELLDKEGRIRLITEKINICTDTDDTDTLIKLVALLDKIDDRESKEDKLKQQIIIQLPDNNRDDKKDKKEDEEDK